MATNLDADLYSSVVSEYNDAFEVNHGLVRFIESVLAGFKSKAHFLDVGCGTGRPVATTIDAAGHSITGIDYSNAMVQRCREAVPNGHFEVADMTLWEPPHGRRFDAVLNILSLFALNRGGIEAMAPRWNRWLPVGGLLCIATVAGEALKPATGEGVDEDGRCVRGIPWRFLGMHIKLTLLTRLGWETLLEESGFEVVRIVTDTFVPRTTLECSFREQLLILARKVR